MSWDLVEIGTVAEVNPRLPKNTDESQRVSFLGMASISEDGKILEQEDKILSETKKGFTYFERNDVLLAKITPCFENGKAAFISDLNTQIGYGSTEFHVLRSNEERLDAKYLFYMLWSDNFRYYGEHSMSGAAGQKRVSANFVKQYKIPLPPLKEQKRIAAILDKADNLRRKRQQAIQLADEFLRAVFLDMFGDPVSNPKRLNITSIGQLCDVSSGSTPSRKIDAYYSGNIPWVKTTEVDGYIINDTEEKITEEGLSNSSCKINPTGSLVVAMYGQGKTRGKIGVLGVDAATNQACAVIKPSSSINMQYLYNYLCLSYESLRSLGQGGGQPNLNLSIVKDFPVLLPSADAQDKFVTVSKKIISMNDYCGKSDFRLREIFRSLSQKAFAGNL